MTDDLPLMDALVQVSFDVMAILSRVGAANDLSLTQLRVLAILRDREPRMAELADHLGLDRSSVSGLIDRASRRGLVTRVAGDDDRRSVRVTLSASGHELASALAAEISARVAELTHSLSGPEQRRLTRLLGRVLGSTTAPLGPASAP